MQLDLFIVGRGVMNEAEQWYKRNKKAQPQQTFVPPGRL